MSRRLTPILMSLDITQLTDNEIEHLSAWSPRLLAAAIATAARRVLETAQNFAHGLAASGVADMSMSTVVVNADLVITADAGTSLTGASADLAAVMGNVLDNGDALTQTHNNIAGVIGRYSLFEPTNSNYPVGAVLAAIGDSSVSADGAFVAFLDGDGDNAVTTAGAAFKVRTNNGHADSGFDFGLDLQDAAHDSLAAVDAAFYLKAPVRLVSDVVELVGAGAPSNGSTGATVAGPGSRYTDITNANLYINGNTKASPTWKLVTRAA